MKKAIFLLLWVVFSLALHAQESQTIYNFLRLPVSSHAAALGGDNISLIEDDATLAIHNPALLASVTDRTLNLGYMNYMSGANLFSAGYAFAQGEKATIGIAAQYLNYGSMKHTNSEGTILGEFNASDLALNGTLSYPLAKNLMGGVTARFIYSKIGDYSSTAVGIDLGLNYFDEENDFSASIVAKNLGGQLSAYDEEYESMPADLQLGITKRIIGTPFRVSLTAVDLTRWNYSLFRHMVFGADLLLSDQIYLSAGYNFRRAHEMKVNTYDSFGDNSESSHGAGLSFGGGLIFDSFSLGVSYAKYHVSSSSLMINAAFTL